MATGWLTDDTDADTYLSVKPGASDWASLSTADKTSYLTESYRMLLYDPVYSWPVTVSTEMQYAQIELAWFIYNNTDLTKRLDLMNAGVESFRIGQFSESYTGKKAGSTQAATVYPFAVLNLISAYKKTLKLGTVRKRLTTDTV